MGKNGESSRGKMGKNGGKWGKMGENGGKWGGNGEEMGRKWGERGPVAPPKFPYFPPFSPIFPHFPPIFPHFPPVFPIFPHFPLPWVHCGYVCGYSTRHRRVLLSPEWGLLTGCPDPLPLPACDRGADGPQRCHCATGDAGLHGCQNVGEHWRVAWLLPDFSIGGLRETCNVLCIFG